MLNRQLNHVWVLEFLALAIIVVGCGLVVWYKEFAAFGMVGVASFVLSGAAFLYSLKTLRSRGDRSGAIAVTGSIVLLVAAIIVGFLGYAAGV